MPVEDPFVLIERAVSSLCPDSSEIVVTVSGAGRLPFQVHVYRKSAAEVVATEPRRDPTPTEQAVVDLLRDHPGLLGKQVAKRLKVTVFYIRRVLARAKRRGFIRHTPGKGYTVA